MSFFTTLRERYFDAPIAEKILKSMQQTTPLAPEQNLQTFAVPVGFNGAMATYNKRMTSAGGIEWAVLRSLSVNHETTRAAINVRKREIIQLGYDVVEVNDDSDVDESDAIASRRDEARSLITNIGGDGVRFREILDKLIEDTLVLDACVFYKQRTRNGKLLRIVPVDGATIKLRVDEAGMRPKAPEFAFEQWIRGQKTADLTTEDLSYEMMNPRSDNPYGLSPIESLIITLDSSMRAALYNLAYLSDNSVPQGFLNVPEEWKIQQIKDYTEYLHALIASPKAQAKIFPIPARAKYQPTSKPQDFAFKDFYDYLDRKVCMLFDVTPQELGLSLQQYKENAEGQDRIQIRKGIKPLANFLQEIFTDLLRDELGFPNFAFKFTGLDTRFTPDDAKILIPLGVIGGDEVRNDMGLKKLGIKNFVITSQGVTPVDQIELASSTTISGQQTTIDTANEPDPSVDPEDQQPKQKAISAEELMKIARNVTLDKLEQTVKYRTIHAKFQKAIKQQIAPFTKEATIQEVSTTEKADVKVDKVGSTMPSLQIQGFQNYLKWAATQGGQAAYDSLGINTAFKLNNPAFDEMLGDRENYLIDSVDATTKQWLVDQISQGHDAEMTNADIAQQIADQSDEFSLFRANMITNTETANATQTAELNTYQEQGVTKKVWVLSEDVGDQCGENADQGAISIDDAFSSGDDAPPAHPNCRCFIQADVESIQAMYQANMQKGWITRNGAHILINDDTGKPEYNSSTSTHISTQEEAEKFAKGSKITDTLYHGSDAPTQEKILAGKGFHNSDTDEKSLFGKGVYFATTEEGAKDYGAQVTSAKVNVGSVKTFNSPDDFYNGQDSWKAISDPNDYGQHLFRTYDAIRINNVPGLRDDKEAKTSYVVIKSPSMTMPFLGADAKSTKMDKGWVTINGAHVLIGGDERMGGLHDTLSEPTHGSPNDPRAVDSNPNAFDANASLTTVLQGTPSGVSKELFATNQYEGKSQAQIDQKVQDQLKGQPDVQDTASDYNWAVSTVPINSINDAAVDSDKTDALTNVIKEGATLPPVLVTNGDYGRLDVVDGNHRVAAARNAGEESISVLLGRLKS